MHAENIEIWLGEMLLEIDPKRVEGNKTAGAPTGAYLCAWFSLSGKMAQSYRNCNG
jgi:hypothetical protein